MARGHAGGLTVPASCRTRAPQGTAPLYLTVPHCTSLYLQAAVLELRKARPHCGPLLHLCTVSTTVPASCRTRAPQGTAPLWSSTVPVYCIYYCTCKL
eukprot:1186060-Prorocentrum_minimum.AAC.3